MSENDWLRGYIDGLTGYAWWKDGTQYVGTSGVKLSEAIEAAERPWQEETESDVDDLEEI